MTTAPFDFLIRTARKLARALPWNRTGEGEVAALRRRVRFLEEAVARSPLSIVVTDPSGRIEFVNPAFEGLTGYTRSEAIGQRTSLLKSGSQGPAFYQELWETIQKGEVWTGQFHNRKKDGELFWEQATISPLFDSRNAITHYVAVKEDVTRQNKRELELEVAYSKAKAADQAKTEFLATMSHELRTPLNTIIGLTSVLIDQPLEAKIRDQLKYVNRSGEHLLGLIEDLLSLTSKPNAYATQKTKNVCLLELLTDTLHSIATTSGKRSIDLQYSFDPELPSKITCNATKVKQILINLLNNAIKHTDCGYVKLMVRLAARKQNEATMVFSVSDTGSGIDSKDIQRIFEPFYQADSSARRRHGGAGLGLAITKNLVESMGGKIAVDSALARGSEFSFQLTFETPPEDGRIFEECAQPEFRGKTILTTVEHRCFKKTLDAIGSVSGMLIRYVQPNDLLDAPPADVAILGEDSQGAEDRLLSRHPKTKILRYGIEAASPNRKLSLPRHPLPKNIVDTLKSALSSASPSNPSSTEQAEGGASSKSQLALEIPLRILAVDDIESNRMVAKIVLSHLGYQIDIATGGHDCLELVSKKRYDLLLLDLQMPDLDGLSVYEQLQARKAPDSLPKVVALTANAQDSMKSLCLERGMSDYLPKPINATIMRTCIKELFAAQPRPEEPPPASKPTSKPASPPPASTLDPEQMENITFDLSPAEAHQALSECKAALDCDFQGLLPELAQARRDQNDEELISLVHGLKGAFQTIGWPRAAAYCQQALKELRAKAFDGYEGLENEIVAHYELGSAALQSHLDQLMEQARRQEEAP